MSVSMTGEAITARLREAAAATDLRIDGRLHAKIDMSPEAVTARLKEVEMLRRACLQLGQMRPVK